MLSSATLVSRERRGSNGQRKALGGDGVPLAACAKKNSPPPPEMASDDGVGVCKSRGRPLASTPPAFLASERKGEPGLRWSGAAAAEAAKGGSWIDAALSGLSRPTAAAGLHSVVGPPLLLLGEERSGLGRRTPGPLGGPLVKRTGLGERPSRGKGPQREEGRAVASLGSEGSTASCWCGSTFVCSGVGKGDRG